MISEGSAERSSRHYQNCLQREVQGHSQGLMGSCRKRRQHFQPREEAKDGKGNQEMRWSETGLKTIQSRSRYEATWLI